MSERNGPDIAAVYQLLTEVARIVSGHDRRFDAVDARLDARMTGGSTNTLGSSTS